MYNSLPWEEDITRVYVWGPVGMRQLRGAFYCFHEKKRWYLVYCGCTRECLCAFMCVWVYARFVVSERKSVRTK